MLCTGNLTTVYGLEILRQERCSPARDKSHKGKHVAVSVPVYFNLPCVKLILLPKDQRQVTTNQKRINQRIH